MDTIEVTEKQRLQLEQSIAKLQKALKHWHVQSAEYEGLKEELLALPRTASRNDMLAIADEFGGDVITRLEITSFLGDKEGIKRSPVQVAEAVRHRIDYVQENINKLEKHLELGETTLDNVRVIENSGQLTNEEGLPVMDIREDLDEQGNVTKSDIVSSSGGVAEAFNVQAAVENFQPLLDTLAQRQQEKEKLAKSADNSAGRGGSAPAKPAEPAPKPANTVSKPANMKGGNKTPTKEQIQQKQRPAPKTQPRVPKRIDATEKEYSPQSGMVLVEKRVKPKLVPDVKEEPPKPTDLKEEPISVKDVIANPPEPTGFITSDAQLAEIAKKEGVARIRVLDDEDDDSDASDDPFENLPGVEEPEEDAQLREEMIKYNMKNMNNIVAEIELEEQGMWDDDDDDDDDDDEDNDYDDDEEEMATGSEEDEDEDDWGRSRGQLVSNKLRREMQKLQKKIEAREKAEQVAAEVATSAALAESSTATVQGEPALKNTQPEPVKKEKKKSSGKKGVRFAEELDIAPAPTPISKPPSNPSEFVKDDFDDEDIDPSILDMVFGPGARDQEERYFHQTTEEPKKKLPSLFRAAREVRKAKEQLAVEKATNTKGQRPSPSADITNNFRTHIPGSYDIIERVVSTSAPMAPQPTARAPVRTANKNQRADKKAIDEDVKPAPLDPLGDELSDEGRPIMASSVIEREPTWPVSQAAKPSSVQRTRQAPDELDPGFHQREVTNAYFAMRNTLIQRQGGFVETEEEKSIVPIDENMEKKKVSRFKAGRVKSQLP
ncbi:hypothetical protein DRE_06589 [Drechslerella stenobrocha 248]|uniref:DUF3835 domain-containing protein n=1 Tax=Drechslerella stenobrocha 248 TaxID=1043628 RepID=W7HXQ0_9PEZI|nr:hypothetical protein DRE_06589 [Drechslerella stenobrocha 248]